MSDYSSSFTSCFRPTSNTTKNLRPPPQMVAPPPPPPPISHNPNLTTTLYHTDFGLAALTWCRHLVGRSLHIDLRFQDQFDDISSSFHLYMKPFLFWRKQGCKKFRHKSSPTKLEIHWNLSKSKFHQNPEPQSGFFIAIVANNEMILLVGDSSAEAYARTKARKPERPQDLILRREHVFGNKLYTTKARFGGKTREISIDCGIGEEPKLCFSVDGQRVLQVKRLKWKFRGNERIEVDGVSIQVSWDVFNWLFDEMEDGHAVFMFRFEEEEGEEIELKSNDFLGMNGFERKKLKGSSFKTRSSSSSSMSSASSGGSSSVMEWASMEENELHSQSGFSLLVYAWKS